MRAIPKVGRLRARGAFNAAKLSDADAKKASSRSSGNHAQALGARGESRHSAHIVMPKNATPVSRKAVEGYGANVVECEPTLTARRDDRGPGARANGRF